MLAHKCRKDNLPTAMIAIEFNIFNKEFLEFRRQYTDLRWLYNLLNSKIDSPEILSSIPLNVPNITLRSNPTFHISTHKKNHFLFALVNPILMLGNKLETFDFFSTRYLD